MTRKLLLMSIVVFVASAAADDHSDRANLIGTWQSQEDGGSTWSLQSSGDDLHVIHSQNGQKVMDFKCNTLGRECSTKESGHDTKVSMWYSGPKLVVLETKGSEVVKRRLSSAAGEKMQLEVISIVPDRKPELRTFVRSTESAQTHQ